MSEAQHPVIEIEGWKDIAKFLGVDERSAQRYVARKLPVAINHRHRICAVVSELQRWMAETRRPRSSGAVDP